MSKQLCPDSGPLTPTPGTQLLALSHCVPCAPGWPSLAGAHLPTLTLSSRKRQGRGITGSSPGFTWLHLCHCTRSLWQRLSPSVSLGYWTCKMGL